MKYKIVFTFLLHLLLLIHCKRNQLFALPLMHLRVSGVM